MIGLGKPVKDKPLLLETSDGGAPEVQARQILFSTSSGYSVLEIIGEGCFGQVARCQHLASQEMSADKIPKDTD